MWTLMLLTFFGSEMEQVKIPGIGSKIECEKLAMQYIDDTKVPKLTVKFSCLEVSNGVNLPSAGLY